MNRGVFFFLGLLVGILICVLLFYFDIKLFEAKIPGIVKKEVVTKVVKDTVFVENAPKPKKYYPETQVDELETEEVVNDESGNGSDDASLYNSEFTFEGQDEVFADQLLRTRTVKVTLLHPEKQENTPDNYFRFFEIQQWSTPIKNRITYHRDQNMVKIKGMEIDKVNVVLWKESYFLEVGNRYYSIPETIVFEKLNTIAIPQ